MEVEELKELKESIKSQESLGNSEGRGNSEGNYKSSFFQKYEIDKRFTNRFFGIVEVPSGFEMVKYHWGKVKDHRGPGISLLWGLGGLYQSAVVMDKRLRTSDYKVDNKVTTLDGVELEKVDYTVDWRVMNAMQIRRGVQDYEKTLREATEGRVRDAVGSTSSRKLSGISIEEMLGGKGDGFEYDDINEEYGLLGNGIRVESLYLTQTKLPGHLEEALASEATAAAEAEGRKKLADAAVYEAGRAAEAAGLLYNTPGAMDLERLKALEKIGENGNATFFPTLGELFNPSDNSDMANLVKEFIKSKK